MASASAVMKYATAEHSRESLDTEKPLLFLAPELIFKSSMQMYTIFGATFGGHARQCGTCLQFWVEVAGAAVVTSLEDFK